MYKALWILIFLAVLVWSGINPKDTYTWVLEVSPAVIGLIILAATYQSFPLTPLLYILILIHCIILMVGGHYTYLRMVGRPFVSAGTDGNGTVVVGHVLAGTFFTV